MVGLPFESLVTVSYFFHSRSNYVLSFMREFDATVRGGGSSGNTVIMVDTAKARVV